MNQKFKTVIALLLILTLGFVGSSSTQRAKADNNYLVVKNGVTTFQCEPGDTKHIEIPIQSKVFFQSITGITVKFDSNGGPVAVQNIKLTDTLAANELTTMQQGNEGILSFDVILKDTATIGTYNFDICFTGSGYDWDNGMEFTLDAEQLLPINIIVINEKAPIQLVVDSINYGALNVVPGNTFTIDFRIKNEGEITAYNTFFSVDYSNTPMIPGYTVESRKIGTIVKGAVTTVTLPIEVLADAESGNYALGINLTCKDADGNEKAFSRSVYINVTSGSKSAGAVLELETEKNTMEVKADSEISLELGLKNIGTLKATGITVAVDGIGVDTGIIKGFAESELKIEPIETGKSSKVLVPLKITDKVTGGLKELTLTLNYNSNTTAKQEKITYYLVVDAAEEAVKSANYITINSVAQSPANPMAGEGLTVSFNINNNGDADITNFKVNGIGLSSSGFEPINSEPYQIVGDIAANQKKTVTMKFIVGKNITEGLNTLTVGYEYFDGDGVKQEDQVNFYILNVQNPVKEETVSKPKLIVSNYGVDSEELRAGSTFNFEFELTNTHSTKAAKNITVTISQGEDVFSPTQGSNSFYISSIEAGESAINSLPMKVKTSTATGAYDVVITVQYEYDDMSEADATKGGVEESHNVKLNAIENSRPMIENIYMENWDGVYVGTDMSMSFEFYNMGMSSLNNVFVTVEGDFVLSNNSEMKYVGSLSSYMSEYVDLSVVPLVEGDAVGKVVVHFEDSTGAEITMDSEFTTFVSSAMDDFGDGMGDYIDDPYIDYNGEMPVDSGEVEEEEIMPLWLFITIQCVLVLAALLITYKVVVSVKKRKLKRSLEEE